MRPLSIIVGGHWRTHWECCLRLVRVTSELRKQFQSFFYLHAVVRVASPYLIIMSERKGILSACLAYLDPLSTDHSLDKQLTSYEWNRDEEMPHRTIRTAACTGDSRYYSTCVSWRSSSRLQWLTTNDCSMLTMMLRQAVNFIFAVRSLLNGLIIITPEKIGANLETSRRRSTSHTTMQQVKNTECRPMTHRFLRGTASHSHCSLFIVQSATYIGE